VCAHVPLHVQLADKPLCTKIAGHRLEVFEAAHMISGNGVHLGFKLSVKLFAAIVARDVLLGVVVLSIGVCVRDRSVASSFMGFFMFKHFSCSKVWLEAEFALKDGLSFEQK